MMKQSVIKPLNQTIQSPQNYFLKLFLVKQAATELYQLEFEHFLQENPFELQSDIWQQYLDSSCFQSDVSLISHLSEQVNQQMNKFYVKCHDLTKIIDIEISEEFR